MSSLRLVLAIIIQKNLEIYALDVKTAFLNGDLQETIYMGYNDNSGRVCKLLKSLYGLKQAPRQWFKPFTDFIIHLNFQQLNCEASIFVRRSKQSEIFIVLYVDDLLIAGSDDSEVGVVIQLLRNEFEMSKAEVANEFLGISYEYSQNKLSLGQKAYVEKVLNKFRMADCKPFGTPLVPKSTSLDFANSERFHGPYRELVGSLLYLSMTTRPDILYSVNCLSQIQEQPTNSAWAGLKRILRYLKGTSELQLLFCKFDSDNIMINVYVDADWGADTYDRKSTSGYIIFFNDCP
ncbi:Copia protein [Araneus ventricosus]|uniref:Copia protein n=1 Tax=Araneus ventricosus TaxID=182803 RepID=A0A4Y2TPW3_ARAVE|nr:Copia protein [Araneus ventricosus]